MKFSKYFFVLLILNSFQLNALYQDDNGYKFSLITNIYTFVYSLGGTVRSSIFNANVRSFYGGGSIISSKISIKAKYYLFNGTISSSGKCDIKAEDFGGNGSIDCDTLTIDCDKFNFNGSINCVTQCNIYSKKPFDLDKLREKSKGNFSIIICPYGFIPYTKDSLINSTFAELCCSCIQSNESLANALLKKSRTMASLNKIDDMEVLKEVKESIIKKINYHEEHLNETRNVSALHSALIRSAAGTIGLGSAGLVYKYGSDLKDSVKQISNSIQDEHIDTGVTASAIALGTASLIPVLLSLPYYYRWLNPKHKEKLAGYKLILKRIEEAIVTPREVEEQFIEFSNN